MQQHSQIVELKDRLQKSIDDSYNVKDINEVTRVITVLERIHITREDLEKTRLGKTINELRRKTTDKELARRSKKLIKTWQSLMVSNGHRNGPTTTATTPTAAAAGYSQNSPAETHDEDSNSSVFSNLSVDGIALANSRSLLGSPSAPVLGNHSGGTSNATKSQPPHNNHNHSSSRKRKHESEADTLRESLNSMISGGRRLQTTQELAQKYNIQIKPSLSASSSPHLQLANNKNDSLSPAKRPKVNGTSYHAKTNGYHNHNNHLHHDENSLDSAVRNGNRYHNKSLPASPALQSLRNNTSHSANTSPALSSKSFENEVVTRPNLKVKIGKNGKLSRQTSPTIATESTSAGSLVNGTLETIKSESTTTSSATENHKPAKRRGTTERTVSEVDRDIREIYAQLPPINPEDLGWKEQFKFDADEPGDDDDAVVEKEEPLLEGGSGELSSGQSVVPSPTPKVKDENVEIDDDDEYELFEYDEEYEEMEDEEVEVTDDEAEEEPEEDELMEIEPCQRVDEDHSSSGDGGVQQQQPLPPAPLDRETVAELSEAGGSNSSSTTNAPQQLPDHTMGDILQCDKPPTSAVSVAGGSDFKSEDGVDGGLEGSKKAQPDSIYNSCDDSNDAISSSTSDALLKRQEADSTTTTVDEQQQNSQVASPDQAADSSSSSSSSKPSQMSEDECVTSSESTSAGAFTLEHANGSLYSEMPPANCNSANSAESALSIVPTTTTTFSALADPLEDMFIVDDELAADIELLAQSVFTDPSGEFYTQFPPTTPMPPMEEEAAALLAASMIPSPPDEPMESAVVNQQQQPPANNSSTRSPPADEPMEVKASGAKMALSSGSSSSGDDDDDDDDDEDEDKDSSDSESDGEGQQPQEPSPPTPQPPTPPPERRVRRRTKRIVIRMLKKKYRKCVGRSRVKRAIVDRLSQDQWENVNGNFDKDGVWHDFSEVTSAYVFTGGKNAATAKTEENVLHILPYVNCTW